MCPHATVIDAGVDDEDESGKKVSADALTWQNDLPVVVAVTKIHFISLTHDLYSVIFH